MSNKKQLVVIGNGMVGHKFLQSMVNSDEMQNYDITTFCEETRFAYDRVQLSSYFNGKTEEDLSLVEPDFFEKNNITVHIGDRAAHIDRDKKIVTSDKGQRISYDKIVLATGSFPFVPPIPGHERENCFVYRTIDDLIDIAKAGKESKVGVVIGGGLLGLEAAKALKDLGLKTHVVEFAPRLMAVQIDDGAGAVLRKKIEELGVSVHTQKNTQGIVDGEQCLHRMNFADGSHIETDVILFSAGIRPRDDIARDCGLTLGERGGIVIDDHCQTSDKDIYAIGECALWDGKIFGLVAPGYQMAQVVADRLSLKENSFTGADMSTKLKLMGVDVASIGDAHATTEKAKIYTYVNGADDVYKKIVVSEDNKRLLGAVLIGDTVDYGNLLQLKLNDIALPEYPDALILPQRDGSGATGLGVEALPDAAQICSCFDVSKGALCQAISDGATTMASLKECTSATTGCGGCTALVGQVLNKELEKLGMDVNTDLCEHFAYTRQDLYHLVRVGKIKTFDEMIEKHGKGYGCDICKPTLASIFASCWNDYVLETPHTGLQDTNDRYLANIQKNGTYSIVPRIPGGEITPDKLITLGEVGKKYNLYTKITGGQRVDLFGAHQEDLPVIWKELIDAGFETGHAYGKSLRTVKSCVGSTWCRYGVADSVTTAIDLENRYKGLRTPHKIKFAVSGCTRECAEAQSKDVGVIATENGWNLYLCGNGGMKPRHADLFATGLDYETMIQYIDRFLMFYVKTADRLQRTSTWMMNLEGGIDYLREVVIEDSLGLAETFETEMQNVIDTYQCEWKTTVENEEKSKTFKAFVNSDKGDSQIVFVSERDQIRPARKEEIPAQLEEV
ncbi:MAG: nitrite reductase large subunit NirB [Cycloclasticus pugetii]|jgi:nitrite reductase (NADH) large subunit|uniref:Nitrate reductase electron transfer subunit n=1 Tax=Cycloclasticus pugetii TaxID=34068 RepID=A0AB33Z459_9GAMM|nr:MULTISPECIES: nitrite reductase large subunit NirB [Cycloclasticus]ATI03516.1 nitrite reductase large subunit [Cycloclasticus sp. PY97N]EPD13999.1 nitrate reductase electron transfer subunit [Cycloclasticus pugetii]MBV1897984.1 nitrite reductase large subunit NirB [Cycloclasticus sp.]SHJ05488.1 assimilatory nitrite reductase (NAD(P)H) large subunit precursor [Cycloclasticus pugetii]